MTRDQYRSICVSEARGEDDGDCATDTLIQYFKKEKANCCFLFHNKPTTIVPPRSGLDATGAVIVHGSASTTTVNNNPIQATDDPTEGSCVPQVSTILTNEFHSLIGDATTGTINHGSPAILTEKEASEVELYASTNRGTLGVEDHQALLIAYAWVLPVAEGCKFSAFPHVLHVDATAGTNKETRPLVTVCGRDSKGEMFTVL